jgi:hypothetical protein
MKIKSKSHISNNNKNVVYVINNNPPSRRRQYKRKASMNPTEQGGSTSGMASSDNPSSQIRLPDNRFLNSSNLSTEAQRVNLQLLENPQLRINQPNIPLLENNYEQRLLQIQDYLHQQQENARYNFQYILNRFGSNPRIDEPVNEDDNDGNFAGTEGSDYFVSEGDDKPDYKDINTIQSQPRINEINTTPLNDSYASEQSYQPEVENISVRKSVKKHPKRNDLQFTSPPPKFALPPPQEKSPYNFDEIPIDEPDTEEEVFNSSPPKSYKAPPKTEKKIGVNDQKKIILREQYKKLGGTNNSILNSPLHHIKVTDMRKYIEVQQKINDEKHQYQYINGGKDPDILNSNSLNDIRKANNLLIKQSNSRKKV